MPKTLDPVQMAKDISKLTKVPLPKVAAVMQKYPLNGPGIGKAFDECRALAAQQMEKDLKNIFGL
jgi:hypothetical protein